MTRVLSTRAEYGRTLVRLGERSRDLMVLDADLSGSTGTAAFAKRFPNRFFNMGISEQDLMCTAAGMSLAGKIPFVSSFAIFATGRCWEQIRNAIALPGCNVNIVATHAGITVGKDGASHQGLEDIAVMRAIPTMTVIVPADAVATRKAVEAAAWFDAPVYIRLTREELPVIYSDEQPFRIGAGTQIRAGEDVTIFAVGLMLHQALEAADRLSEENISARVVDPATVKPVDEYLVTQCARETGCVVTAEEHNVCGGLGDAVGEVLLRRYPVPMERVAVQDSFGRSGDPADLLEYFDLTPAAIVLATKRAVARKRGLS
uniref:Transketolase subunit B n=1 Tax=Candidatus Kentrum sp. MB TaxID=2138164 RepID=A0A450X5L1_9GAMM|nr:MAG: transketolase subunit B [Candidatus Kentron sp. MB]VFK27126.1 MAG: transketolase subunit B [Candidatus Kentron sp. MB]VFK74897.1 MAG: transketolase subunit B [Candidatus Kentron sp. MB]